MKRRKIAGYILLTLGSIGFLVLAVFLGYVLLDLESGDIKKEVNGTLNFVLFAVGFSLLVPSAGVLYCSGLSILRDSVFAWKIAVLCLLVDIALILYLHITDFDGETIAFDMLWTILFVCIVVWASPNKNSNKSDGYAAD